MTAHALWQAWGLDCGGPRSTARPTLSNAVKILQKDPVLHGVVWYDAFLDRVLTGTSPREWQDADDLNLTVDLQDRLELATISVSIVHDAVVQVAHRRERHVVQEYLTGLRWDGEPRIELAFEDYWGVVCGPDAPCDYVRAASGNLFIGLVARVFQPGCQLDTMVVFEGEQGAKKTSALRVLGGPWYGLSSESVTRKDFFEGLQGKWIVELGELDAFSRAEVTRVKTVISTPIDRYRPSYGRSARDFPRQCVFCGTTNRDDWGNDETGLRRFWPIACGPIDIPALTAARDQLFAEALVRYRSGSTWWEMPNGSTQHIQWDRQHDDPWADLIVDGVSLLREVTMDHVLRSILHLEVKDCTIVASMRVGRILRLAGWNNRNLRRDGKQGKRWVRERNPSVDE